MTMKNKLDILEETMREIWEDFYYYMRIKQGTIKYELQMKWTPTQIITQRSLSRSKKKNFILGNIRELNRELGIG